MDFNELFNKAKKLGFNDIQARVETLEEIRYETFKGTLDKHTIADTTHLSLKGILDGRMGKLSTEDLDFDNADAWLQSLKASAKAVESGDEAIIYGGDDSYSTFDPTAGADIDTIDALRKKDLALDLDARIADGDERIAISEAIYAEAKRSIRLVNSKGLDLARQTHNAVLVAEAVAREGDDSRTAFEYIQTNRFADFDSSWLARKAVEKSTSLLGSKSIPSGRYQVLLENKASANLLQAHVNMFNAEHVQKGLSKLAGKSGEPIAGENFTLVDDPFIEKSAKSATFDDEGVATSRRKLVDSGRLEGYLHDLKTARKAGVAPTGNGFGGSIRPTNLHIAPGSEDVSSLRRSLDRGLIITDLQGLHSGTSTVSADFSLQASGYYVENGEIVKPVSLITVSGNYLDWMGRIQRMGDDLTFNISFVGSPSILIEDVVVSGT